MYIYSNSCTYIQIKLFRIIYFQTWALQVSPALFILWKNVETMNYKCRFTKEETECWRTSAVQRASQENMDGWWCGSWSSSNKISRKNGPSPKCHPSMFSRDIAWPAALGQFFSSYFLFRKWVRASSGTITVHSTHSHYPGYVIVGSWFSFKTEVVIYFHVSRVGLATIVVPACLLQFTSGWQVIWRFHQGNVNAILWMPAIAHTVHWCWRKNIYL